MYLSIIIKGDYDNTIRTFKMAKLIDDEGHWSAGNAVFVQTGTNV